ncbi:hypothetical protein EPN18_01430 [bacterium]|nr:MAG: hypothetical protein EPN18_01430 [bacterium]
MVTGIKRAAFFTVLAAVFMVFAFAPVVKAEGGPNKRAEHKAEMRAMEDRQRSENRMLEDKCESEHRSLKEKHHKEREELKKKFWGDKEKPSGK